MPVIPRTEKSSNNLSVVVEDLGELCNGNTIPGLYEISTPPWLGRLRCFSRNLRVAGSSPTRDTMVYLLKALETFTLVTPTLRSLE